MRPYGSEPYYFKVSELEDGSFWIYFEPIGKPIDLLKDVVFGIDLKKETTMQEAAVIASFLRDCELPK